MFVIYLALDLVRSIPRCPVCNIFFISFLNDDGMTNLDPFMMALLVTVNSCFTWKYGLAAPTVSDFVSGYPSLIYLMTHCRSWSLEVSFLMSYNLVLLIGRDDKIQ